MKTIREPDRAWSIYPALLLLLALLLAACNGSTQATSPSDFNVQLTAAPEGRSGTYLTVRVTDKENNPVTDAQVGLEGDMTHAGMAPVIADPVADDADGTLDGVYQVPFAFSMAGDWLVTVVIDRNGTTERHEIKATVNEQDIVIEGVSAANNGQVASAESETHSVATNPTVSKTITIASAIAKGPLNATDKGNVQAARQLLSAVALPHSADDLMDPLPISLKSLNDAMKFSQMPKTISSSQEAV